MSTQNFKMKFLVVRASTEHGRARIEWFASEREYRGGCKAGRTVFIADVLNVEKTSHPDHHFVFTVFTKAEKMAFVAEFPDERDSWVEAISFAKNQAESDQSLNGSSIHLFFILSVSFTYYAQRTRTFPK